MVEPGSEILTLDEIVSCLKVGKRTIYQLAASGEIPAFKPGGTWRFSLSNIESWIHQQLMGNLQSTVSNASSEGDRKKCLD